MRKYNIRNIFTDMELDLIKSMQRNLKRHEDEEEKEGREWEQWQQRKLQDLQKYRKETQKISKQYEQEVEQEAEAGIRGAFKRGAERVKNTVKGLWDKITGKKPAVVPEDGSDESFFRVNESRVNALATAARKDMQQARHAMLRQADDVYRQTIYKAQVYMNSGAASLNQAIDMATRDFLDRGFDSITYANGRRVNVASYAEMALRTASQRQFFPVKGRSGMNWGSGLWSSRHTLIVQNSVYRIKAKCSSMMCIPAVLLQTVNTRYSARQ